MYLQYSKLGAIGLPQPQRQGSVVREVGVIWAGTEEVEGDGDVKGKHADRHVPAIHHRGQTAVEEDAGGWRERGVRGEIPELYVLRTLVVQFLYFPLSCNVERVNTMILMELGARTENDIHINF